MMERTALLGVNSRRSCKSSQNLSTSASSALLLGAYTWIAVILNGLPWKSNSDHFVVFETASKYCILGCYVDSISSKGFLPTLVDIRSSELNLPVPVHFSSLIPKMSMFTLAIGSLTTPNFP